MRTIRSRKGPFATRPHFSLTEIERTCTEELQKAGLLPSSPEAIRIERFIEKRFKVTPQYEDLPDGILGFTEFGRHGVKAIVVSRALDGEGTTKATERRLRSTLAHEGGHGLLHAHLFLDGEKPKQLFGGNDSKPEILCRDIPGEKPHSHGYDGRWWEFQANKAIGGLLMPRRLMEMVAQKFTVEVGMLGTRVLAPEKREIAAREIAEIFEVNPAAARIRIEDVFPSQKDGQMAL